MNTKTVALSCLVLLVACRDMTTQLARTNSPPASDNGARPPAKISSYGLARARLLEGDSSCFNFLIGLRGGRSLLPSLTESSGEYSNGGARGGSSAAVGSSVLGSGWSTMQGWTDFWGGFNEGTVSLLSEHYLDGQFQNSTSNSMSGVGAPCLSGPEGCREVATTDDWNHGRTCGAGVNGRSSHTAYQLVDGYRVGPSYVDMTWAQDEQSACGSGGGGGDGGMSCYTESMCWDAYDANTYEYLWTWCGPTTVCEENQS